MKCARSSHSLTATVDTLVKPIEKIEEDGIGMNMKDDGLR